MGTSYWLGGYFWIMDSALQIKWSGGLKNAGKSNHRKFITWISSLANSSALESEPRLNWAHFGLITSCFDYYWIWLEVVMSALETDQGRKWAHISLIKHLKQDQYSYYKKYLKTFRIADTLKQSEATVKQQYRVKKFLTQISRFVDCYTLPILCINFLNNLAIILELLLQKELLLRKELLLQFFMWVHTNDQSIRFTIFIMWHNKNHVFIYAREKVTPFTCSLAYIKHLWIFRLILSGKNLFVTSTCRPLSILFIPLVYGCKIDVLYLLFVIKKRLRL